MSCPVWIRRADCSPLGGLEAVKESLSLAFPGVQFYREPSGPEKIAVMRDRGVEFPDVVRLHLEQQPASQEGDFQSERFSVRFFLGAELEIDRLLAELRGDTEDGAPFFRRLAAETGWVVEDETGEPLTF